MDVIRLFSLFSHVNVFRISQFQQTQHHLIAKNLRVDEKERVKKDKKHPPSNEHGDGPLDEVI